VFLVLTPSQDCKGSYTFRRMAMLGVNSSVKVVLRMSKSATSPHLKYYLTLNLRGHMTWHQYYVSNHCYLTLNL